MKILYILRTPGDGLPLSLVPPLQGRGDEVSVLLIHDAVYAPAPTGVKVFACHDDLKARGIEPQGVELLDYQGILNLVLQHDSVTVW